MKRREFIKYVGITSVPLGVAGALPRLRFDEKGGRILEFELAINAGFEEMITASASSCGRSRTPVSPATLCSP